MNQKCQLCDKDAVKTLTPDLDIRGLGACEEHIDDVEEGYRILIFGGEEMYQNYVDSFKK